MAKKILMVIAFETFRDEEYSHPLEVFLNAGYEVTTASSKIGTATGRFGLEVPVSVLYDSVNLDEFDAVVFVGGGGARAYFEDPNAHNIARYLNEKGRLVTAICIAPGILANAGLLSGVAASVYPSENELLADKGASVSSGPVTRSANHQGPIITANGPEAAYDFARAIVEHLEAGASA